MGPSVQEALEVQMNSPGWQFLFFPPFCLEKRLFAISLRCPANKTQRHELQSSWNKYMEEDADSRGSPVSKAEAEEGRAAAEEVT